MSHFRCSESNEHVMKADINLQDLINMKETLTHFNVKHDWPKWIDRAIIEHDKHAMHDAAHYLLEFMLAAHDAGEKTALFYFPVEKVESLKNKQNLCRGMSV